MVASEGSVTAGSAERPSGWQVRGAGNDRSDTVRFPVDSSERLARGASTHSQAEERKQGCSLDPALVQALLAAGIFAARWLGDRLRLGKGPLDP
jgi:hypothetical protein